MRKEGGPQRIVLRIANQIGRYPINKKMEDYLRDYFGGIKVSNCSLKSLSGPAELSVMQEIVAKVKKIEAWGDIFVEAIEIITDSQAITEAIYESFQVGEIQPLLIVAVFEATWKDSFQGLIPKKDEDGKDIFSHYSTFRFVGGNFQEIRPLIADSQDEDI